MFSILIGRHPIVHTRTLQNDDCLYFRNLFTHQPHPEGQTAQPAGVPNLGNSRNLDSVSSAVQRHVSGCRCSEPAAPSFIGNEDSSDSPPCCHSQSLREPTTEWGLRPGVAKHSHIHCSLGCDGWGLNPTTIKQDIQSQVLHHFNSCLKCHLLTLRAVPWQLPK